MENLLNNTAQRTAPQKGDPIQEKYDQARDMFLSDKRFVEADAEGKKELLNRFFDKVSTGYLKERHGLASPTELAEFKESFVKKYIGSEQAEKKKPVSVSSKDNEEVIPDEIAAEPVKKKASTSDILNRVYGKDLFNISVPEEGQTFRRPDKHEEEFIDASRSLQKSLDKANRPPSATTLDAENRAWLDKEEKNAEGWIDLHDRETDSDWREGSTPALPAKYDVELPDDVKLLKEELSKVKAIDQGSDMDWIGRNLGGWSSRATGQAKMKVADEIRERTLESATKKYDETQESLGTLVQTEIDLRGNYAAALKMIAEAQGTDMQKREAKAKIDAQFLPQIEMASAEVAKSYEVLGELNSIIGEANNDVQGSLETGVKEFYNNSAANLPRLASSFVSSVDALAKAPQRWLYDSIMDSESIDSPYLKVYAMAKTVQMEQSDVAIEAVHGLASDASDYMAMKVDMRPERSLARLTGQTTGQLAQMTAAAALGGPAAGIAVGASLSADEMLQSGLDSGLEFKDASLMAGLYMPIGTALEYYGAGRGIAALEKNMLRQYVIDQVLKGQVKMSKKGMTQALKTYMGENLKQSGEELITESIQFMVQDLMQRGYNALQDMEGPRYQNPEFMEQQYKEILGQSAGGGAYAGFLMQAVTQLFGGRRKNFSNFAQTVATDNGYDRLKKQIEFTFKKNGRPQEELDKAIASLQGAQALAMTMPAHYSESDQIQWFNSSMKKQNIERQIESMPPKARKDAFQSQLNAEEVILEELRQKNDVPLELEKQEQAKKAKTLMEQAKERLRIEENRKKAETILNASSDPHAMMDIAVEESDKALREVKKRFKKPKEDKGKKPKKTKGIVLDSVENVADALQLAVDHSITAQVLVGDFIEAVAKDPDNYDKHAKEHMNQIIENWEEIKLEAEVGIIDEYIHEFTEPSDLDVKERAIESVIGFIDPRGLTEDYVGPDGVNKGMAMTYIRKGGQGIDQVAQSASAVITGDINIGDPVTVEDVGAYMQRFPNGRSRSERQKELDSILYQLVGAGLNRANAKKRAKKARIELDLFKAKNEVKNEGAVSEETSNSLIENDSFAEVLDTYVNDDGEIEWETIADDLANEEMVDGFFNTMLDESELNDFKTYVDEQVKVQKETGKTPKRNKGVQREDVADEIEPPFQRSRRAREIIKSGRKGVLELTQKAVAAISKAINVPVIMDAGKFDLAIAIIKAQNPQANFEGAKGFVFRGSIYLDPRRVSRDTAAHEFAHVYLIHLAKNNPKLYARGERLIAESRFYVDVNNNPAYAHLSEKEMLEEAMAQAIGERAADVMLRKFGTNAMVDKFRAWLEDVKAYLGDTFFKDRKFKMTQLTLDQFLDGSVHDLLGGQNLGFTAAKKKGEALEFLSKVKMQVDAWHGSPHLFDKFTTEKIGTGEGAQAFGWGLYFTDVESIARNYSDQITKRDIKKMYDSGDDMPKEAYDALQDVDFLGFDNEWEAAGAFYSGRKPRIMNQYDLTSEQYDRIENAFVGEKRNVYKVSLHKGLDPKKYNYMVWDEPVPETDLDKIETQAKKEGIDLTIDYYTGEQIRFKDYHSENSDKKHGQYSGKGVYNSLNKKLKSPKEASLFLLRAGIDGIKYPAESLARGRTSDNARGFNYVVFDEYVITIEETIKFQQGFGMEQEIKTIAEQLTREGFERAEIYFALIAEGYTEQEVNNGLYLSGLVGNDVSSAFDIDPDADIDLEGADITSGLNPENVMKMAKALAKSFPGVNLNFSFPDFKKALEDAGIEYQGQRVHIDPSGDIYFNPATMTSETPFKAFGRIWLYAAMRGNPSLRGTIGQIVEGTTYLAAAINRGEADPEMAAMVDAIAEESLNLKETNTTFRKRFKKFVNTAFNAFVRPLIGSGGWTSKATYADITKMTLGDFTQKVAEELTLDRKMSPNLRAVWAGVAHDAALYESFVRAKQTSDFQMIRHAMYMQLVAGVKADNLAPFIVKRFGMDETLVRDLLAEIENEIGFMNSRGSIIPLPESRAGLTFMDFRMKIQDRNIWLKKIQQGIEKLSGKRIQDDLNAYTKKELETSKVNEMIESLKEYIYGADVGKTLELQGRSRVFGRGKTNKNSLASRLAKAGLKLEDLSLFMFAKHAPERNARLKELSIKRQNARLEELNSKLDEAETAEQRVKLEVEIDRVENNLDPRYSIVESGARMTDMRSAEILQDYDSKGKTAELENFAKEFKENVIDKRIEILFETGRINEDQYAALLSGVKSDSSVVWENYIPVKIEDAIFDTRMKPSVGSATQIQSATGRGSFQEWQVKNVLNQAVLDLASAIRFQETNTTRQALYDLAKTNPDPTVWNTHVERGIPKYNEDTGEFEEYKSFVSDDVRSRSVEMYRDGKLYYIEFIHDGLREGMLKVSNPGKFEQMILRIFQPVLAFQRSLLTVLNPFFAIPNLTRDIQDALANLSIESDRYNLKGLRAQVLKTMPGAAAAIARNYFAGKESGGKLVEYLMEAKGEGMYMSWANYGEMQDQLERLKEMANESETGTQSSGILKTGVQGFVDVVLGFNEVAEMSTRLSVYAALREKGLSAQAAAGAAKNVTLNFEKKGSSTTLLNSMYLFLNAGIQGVAKTSQLLKSKSGLKTLGAFAVAGLINKALLYAFSEDEDKLALLTSEQWAQNTYVFNPFNPDVPITIPKPYSLLRFAMGLGENVYDLGTKRKTPVRTVADQLKIMQMVFDPVSGNQQNWLSAILPVGLSQAAEIEMGRNFMNAPIYPKYMDDRPDYRQYYNSTHDYYINGAQVLYDNMGVSVSPETMEYLVDDVMGGVVKEVINTGLYVASDEKIPVSKTPMVRRFFTDLTEEDVRIPRFLYSIDDVLTSGGQLAEKEKKAYYANFRKALKDRLLSPYSQDKMIKNAIEYAGINVVKDTYEEALSSGAELQKISLNARVLERQGEIKKRDFLKEKKKEKNK